MRLVHLRVRYGAGALVADPSVALAAAWSDALSARAGTAEWRPPCDLTETAGAWTLTVEIGGLDDDDLEILVYEDSVVVQGSRPWPGAGETARVLAATIRYGPFRLALGLPGAVDAVAARAAYDRGMLTMHLPKRGPP
jgi:HSP20 family molecular chaperone IbpA